MFETLSVPLRNIAQHSAFLLMALPLIGAALVAASSRFGSGAARRSALTNVGLSCFTAVLAFLWLPSLVASSDADAPRTPFASSHPVLTSSILWARWTDPNGKTDSVVRISVGVTEATFLPMTLIPFLALAAVLALRPANAAGNASRHVEVLLIQSLLTGVLVAQDLILLSLSLMGLPQMIGFAAGRSEHLDRRQIGRAFALLGAGGALLVTIALCGIATSVPNLLKQLPEFPGSVPVTLEIPACVRSIQHAATASTTARIGWWSDAGMILGLLMMGIVVLSPLPPFRKLWSAIDAVAPRSLRPLVTAWPLVSWSLAARLFAPLHFQEKPERTLMAVLILMAAFAAVAATRTSDPRERRSARLSTHTAIAIFASLTPAPGVQAAGVWLICVAVMTTALWQCAEVVPGRDTGDDLAGAPFRISFVVPRLTKKWLPLASAFAMVPSMTAVVGGVMPGGGTTLPGPPAAFGLLLLWSLAEWSVLAGGDRAASGNVEPSHPDENTFAQIRPRHETECATASLGIFMILGVAFVALLAIFVAPRLLLSRILF